jgi:hypothetical protein
MEKIRGVARQRLGAIVASSPHFASDSAAADTFTSDLEREVAERYPTPRRFRERVLFLQENLPTVVDELDELKPAFLSSVNELDLKSSKQKAVDDRAARKRARHHTLALKDREDVQCDRCLLPIRARLNTNRFDVEDELLGGQYQNQYENLCECDADIDPVDKFGESRSSSESSVMNDDQGSVPATTAAATAAVTGGPASPPAKANRAE